MCINHAQLIIRQDITLGRYMEEVQYQSLAHFCLKVVVNCTCCESLPLPNSKLLCAHACVCVHARAHVCVSFARKAQLV
jgi:hypothetical protein